MIDFGDAAILPADPVVACREIASQVALAGADVVEVLPDRIGSRDVTALVAERIVREVLTGVALQRRAAGVMRATAGLLS